MKCEYNKILQSYEGDTATCNSVAEGENHFPFFDSFVTYIYLLVLKASATYLVTCSITANTWELVRNAGPQAWTRPTESEPWDRGLWPMNLCLNKLSGWLFCPLKFEVHV